MKQAKHTPGPYAVYGPVMIDGDEPYVIAPKMGNATWPMLHNESVCEVPRHQGRLEEAKANAALVAAAPEMLVALQKAHAALAPDKASGDFTIKPADARDIIAAAIAKAEGRK